LTNTRNRTQDILEKFEFFPIKCRIQRAEAIFQANTRKRERESSSFKTKVDSSARYCLCAVASAAALLLTSICMQTPSVSSLDALEKIASRLSQRFHPPAQVVFFWVQTVRNVLRGFETRPHLLKLQPPPAPGARVVDESHHITLSATQEAQIREIFELFDTDGGGTIDRRELEFAMVAMGFQSERPKVRKGRARSGDDVMETIAGDGTVTLEEFSALMKGELNGRDPLETVRLVFHVLCQGEANPGGDRLITLESLTIACRDLEV
jgi:hypothetical protein